jgi:hypothetical protein
VFLAPTLQKSLSRLSPPLKTWSLLWFRKAFCQDRAVRNLFVKRKFIIQKDNREKVSDPISIDPRKKNWKMSVLLDFTRRLSENMRTIRLFTTWPFFVICRDILAENQ